MGSEVTLVEHHDRVLARLDPDAGNLLRERLEEDGVRVLVEAEASTRRSDGPGVRLELGAG